MERNIWHFVVFAGESASTISRMCPILAANILVRQVCYRYRYGLTLLSQSAAKTLENVNYPDRCQTCELVYSVSELIGHTVDSSCTVRACVWRLHVSIS